MTDTSSYTDGTKLFKLGKWGWGAVFADHNKNNRGGWGVI